MGTPRAVPRFVVFLFAAGVAFAAEAGGTLDTVKARGVVRCGVSEGIAGFSAKDAAGRWTGFDADFCRAVAASVLGDPEKVAFVPLAASSRLPAPQARVIDAFIKLLRE